MDVIIARFRYLFPKIPFLKIPLSSNLFDGETLANILTQVSIKFTIIAY